MNVFEELVVELKEENLLEETVVDGQLLAASDEIDRTDEPNKPDTDEAAEAAIVEDDLEIVETDAEPASGADLPVEEPIKVKKGPQFYQKRAVAEVSSLQMVEHVLTGVEREYQKIVPKSFDDFSVKKALNTFLNVAENVDSEEHKAAEFNLMQETEAWCSALAERDRGLPVSSFRLYCENSRPALSSQAMLGLARFYRNLPYSEAVRSKFDFIITRLFSRPVEAEKRACLFSREDALKHINTLYSEWSSVPLYDVDDDSKVMLTALSFEDLATEAENASNFDQLIESDFFGRLRLFKESINELFFAPSVTAAAIECNVRIGNSYVDLLERERRKMDDDSLQSKYGELHSDTVSDAAARTLDLVELLRNPPTLMPVQEASVLTPESREPVEVVKTQQAPVLVEEDDKPPTRIGKVLASFRAVNRAFLAICLFLVAASFGIWIWSATAIEGVSKAGVSPIAVENNFLGEHIRSAKVSQDVLYGMLKPSWDGLSKEKRQEFVQAVLASCNKEYNCTQVNLLTKDGKAAAYASATRLDINMP